MHSLKISRENLGGNLLGVHISGMLQMLKDLLLLKHHHLKAESRKFSDLRTNTKQKWRRLEDDDDENEIVFVFEAKMNEL